MDYGGTKMATVFDWVIISGVTFLVMTKILNYRKVK